MRHTLKYLNNIPPAERRMLAQKFSTSVEELDQLIQQNPKLFKFFYTQALAACVVLNTLYLSFPLVTSNEGINALVQAFNPNAQVPTIVGFMIGGPLSVIEVISFMLFFSAKNEAAKETIMYLLEPSYRSRIKDFFRLAQTKPFVAAGNALTSVFHKTTLWVYNLTWNMAVWIYLPLELSKPVKWLLTVFGSYLGLLYCKYYSDDDYRSAVSFLSKGRGPFLLQEILRGRYRIPFQVVLLSLCAIVLRTYPYMHFIAAQTEDWLGVWFPIWLVDSLTTWHGVSFYKTMYDHFYNAQIEVDDLLDQLDFVKQHATEYSANTPFSSNTTLIAQLVAEDKCHRREQYIRLFTQQNGYFSYFLKKDRLTGLLITAQASIGGYLGWTIASLFNPLIAIGTVPACAFLVAYPAAKSEIDRIALEDYKIHLKSLLPSAEEELSLPISRRDKNIATTLNWLGCVLGALSVLGTLIGVISPDTASYIIVGIIFINLLRLVVTGYFNQPKNEATIAAHSEQVTSLINSASRLFSCKCRRTAENSASSSSIQIAL